MGSAGGSAGDGDDELDDSVLQEMARHLVAGAEEPPPPAERYELGELLGRGGMATVHRARDRLLGRTVALKFLRDENPLTAARFQREARAQARVEHPHICRVYEVGELEGRSFISMQYVAGPTLAAAAPEMSLRDKVRVVRDVALAVQAAHEAGLVHRDLKPSNILLERGAGGEHTAYVTDFGIARDAGEPGLTMTGQIMGTPRYMAPEQALGRSGLIDARTDVYALGVTLYELLAGLPPFTGETVSAILVEIARGDPPPLRRRDRSIPVDLETIALRCLMREPADRYPTARALAEELGRHLAGEPIATRRPGLLERSWRRARAHPAVVGAVAAVAAAGLVTLAPRPRAPAWRPRLADLGPPAGEPGDGVTFSSDGARIAFSADRDGMMRVYVAPASGEPARAITPADRWANDPRFSRDGRSVLCRMEGGVFRVPVEGGEPVAVAPDARRLEECGERQVILRGRALLVRDADGTLRERVRFDDGQTADSPSCDREGRRVVYSVHPPRRGPSSIWMLDLDGDGDRVELVPAAAQNQHPAFHPDGGTIVFSSARGGATNLWELRPGGGPPVQLTFGPGPDLRPAVSPDGRTLAFAVALTAASLSQLRPGEGAPRGLPGSPDDVQFIDPSPDGRELALEARRQERSVVVVYTLADGRQRVLGEGRLPVWARDGSEVVFLDAQGARLLAAPAAGGAARTVAELTAPVRRLLAADDGQVYLHGLGMRGILRVPLAGGVPEPAPGPEPGSSMFVLPATQLRAVWADAPLLRLLPPGAELGGPGVWTLPPASRMWGADAAGGVVWSRRDEVHRSDVLSGREALVARLPPEVSGVAAAAVAADGTLYYAAVSARVRRQLITNFADRPAAR